jgi:glycosyltransferase involved in cell wall biosynthesis
VKCSVVVPAHNAGRTIGECVLAVFSQSLPSEDYELIVVDDGSTDRTVAIARELGARVISRPPLGIASARNAGAQAARADLIVFLDADCLPKLDWLAEMIRPFADSAVAAVQGAYSSDQTELMPRLIQAECEDTYSRLEAYPSTDVVYGFSAAFRRRVLTGAAGFDSAFAVGDDLELSYRLAKSGQRLVFNARARVYHQHGGSLGRYFERSVRDGLWRSLIHARHPDKSAGDSQTPTALRAEIPLAGLTFASFLLGTRWRGFLPVAGIFAAIFTSVVAPAAWRARRSGAEVALTVPGLHFVRGLGLGSGMAIGRGTIVGQSVANRLERLRRWLRRTNR